MRGNTFGHLYRVMTFGESHGPAVGVVIDGCPAGLPLNIEKIQMTLARRQPGQSEFTTKRSEADRVELLSGMGPVSGGGHGPDQVLTFGTPLTFMVRNLDTKPADYNDIASLYRPSHADFTTEKKFGLRPASGGGRASARETIGRVIAGAVAEQALQYLWPELSVVAWVSAVKDIVMQPSAADEKITKALVDVSPIRCPERAVEASMRACIASARDNGDSVGGVISCLVRGIPAGLGEPVFDKLEADLAKALMSLPASKGFEVGSGFAGTTMFGSQHNDAYVMKDGRVGTASNNSGGIQGGMSNGEPITMRVAFKPVASIARPQQTVDGTGLASTLSGIKGRHDPCVLPRAVPMVEAMVLIVLMDHALRQRAAADWTKGL